MASLSIDLHIACDADARLECPTPAGLDHRVCVSIGPLGGSLNCTMTPQQARELALKLRMAAGRADSHAKEVAA